MNKQLVSKTAMFCWIILAVSGLAVVDSTSSAESIAGKYVWITRAADDPGHAECQAHNAGSECVELCLMVSSGPIPLGRLCCLESWKIGGLDNPEECEYWVH
jgi:hypothetical protein